MRTARRARHAHDAAAVLAEHVSAAERNRCEFIPCEGGFMAVRGYFDPIAAATIKTAVLPLAKRSGYGDHRGRPRRLADALVEVASHALDIGVMPSSGGSSTHFQLTASVETVMGLERSTRGRARARRRLCPQPRCSGSPATPASVASCSAPSRQ